MPIQHTSVNANLLTIICWAEISERADSQSWTQSEGGIEVVEELRRRWLQELPLDLKNQRVKKSTAMMNAKVQPW